MKQKIKTACGGIIDRQRAHKVKNKIEGAFPFNTDMLSLRCL